MVVTNDSAPSSVQASMGGKAEEQCTVPELEAMMLRYRDYPEECDEARKAVSDKMAAVSTPRRPALLLCLMALSQLIMWRVV